MADVVLRSGTDQSLGFSKGDNMAAYVIYNQLEVTDQDAWAEYGSKIIAQMADYGGRILAAEARHQRNQLGC